MSLSTNLVSGLSSGFDWRSMIDNLMAIEHRRVDLVEADKTEYEDKRTLLQTINTKLLTLKTQAETLASSNAFNLYSSSLSTNSTAYSASDFLSVSTSTSAFPGTHTITMGSNSQVAQTRILSSKSFTENDTALSLSGEFVINGRAAKVESSDDLSDIMDKINNLNVGANATGVTASIMTASLSNYRLILTSDNTGADSFNLLDASSDATDIVSSGLGFIDGTVSIKNLISNGVQSAAFSSSSQSISSMLGITTAQSGSVTIGADGDSDQFAATIDLSKTLTQIASDINDARGTSNILASVVATTDADGVETYRIKLTNATQFGNADNDGDVNNVLQTLGFLEGGTADVAEIHDGSVANTASAVNIAAGTYWDQFDVTLAHGDTISFSGTNHIGEIVTGSYTILTDPAGPGTGDQVSDLLDAIELAFTTKNSDYEVSASIVAGKIRITDSDESGDSQLSLAVVANNEGNDSNLDFGTISASTEGYSRQVQAGQDANITIDGTIITSDSNTIDDVIAGVTLNLLAVETDKTVNMTISRDYNTIKSSVQGLLDSYNGILAEIADQTFYDEETQTAGPLQGDSTLSSIKSNLQNIVVSAITGLPTTINALSLIGINARIDYSDPKNNGQLTIDDDLFKDAFEDNFHGLKRIFVAEGTTTDGDVEYVYHTNGTVAGTYDVNITQAAAQASVTGTTDLSSGLSEAENLIITDTVTGRVAEIVFDGTESDLNEIVTDINSELSAEYTEVHYSSTANTKTAGAGGGAITNLTKWSEINGAGVTTNDTIAISGTRRNNTSVQNTYTITDTDDTVQGFLSFIETLYENEVSAYLDATGKLVLQDNTAGDSQLAITVGENREGGGNLNFGALETGNAGGVEGRNALDITASASGNNLQISHDNYGSSEGFTISQTLRVAEQQEIVTTAVTNTTAASDGKAYVIGATTWDEIDGYTPDTGDTLTIWGTDPDGTAINAGKAANYSLYSGSYQDIDSLLTTIESVFGNVDARLEQGRIVVEDLDGGDGSLAVNIQYNGSGSLTLGDGSDNLEVAQTRDTDLGLVNGAHSGLDVQGTINNESAGGSGRSLTGDVPGTGETTSVEGLTIRYTGALTGDQGSVTVTMGVAELFNRVLYDITNAADGYLDYRLESLAYRIEDFEDNIEEMEARLNRKMEVMVNKFVAMELALANIQNQSDWLAAQVSASFSGWGI